MPSVKIRHVSVLSRSEDFIFAANFSRSSLSSLNVCEGLWGLGAGSSSGLKLQQIVLEGSWAVSSNFACWW